MNIHFRNLLIGASIATIGLSFGIQGYKYFLFILGSTGLVLFTDAIK